MEEINAWGAYEAGTTQNARSLGGNNTGVVRRRPAAATTESRRPSLTDSQGKSHALFFGTDDVTTLKKKDGDTKDVEAPEKKEEEEEQSEEVREVCELARDVFHVYSNDLDDNTNTRNSRKQPKKMNLYRMINGTMPHLPSYISKLSLPTPFVSILLFAEASLRGMAQVYFQNNPLSGLFILIGMCVQSSRVAVHGLIAICAGNLTGLLMGFDKSFLSCGLFGYNSFLVGLALATFYSSEKHGDYYWPVVIGVIVFAYFSSVLFVMLGKLLSPYKTPPFTLPFNIATIIFLLGVGAMNNVDMQPVRQPELPSYDVNQIEYLTAQAFFRGSIRGVGQVFLANDIIAGVLVLIGILVCSRISAISAFVGSAIGCGVAALVGCDRGDIENGMYGFNPSLTLSAMLMFYVPSIGSISIGIAASIITVFIQLALAASLNPTGLPFITLPFCIAALAFIVIQGTTSNVISVPLSSMTTPEDHLRRVRKLSNGFELLYGAIRSKSYKGSHHRRSSFLRASLNRSSTERMTSALDEHRESVHGVEKERGLFGLIFQRFKMNSSGSGEMTNSSATEGFRSQLSFRMSFAMRSKSYGDSVKDSYARIFAYIDKENEHEITKKQFREFLKGTVGLRETVGLDFACEAFQLMDFDKSGDIDVDEFIAFGTISKHMPEIRRLVVKFFDFVDVNGDRAVEIRELDDARAYLGLQPLDAQDHDSLVALCNEDEELEFDVIVNFVTIFKLKAIIKEYQRNRGEGLSLDASLHSSFHKKR